MKPALANLFTHRTGPVGRIAVAFATLVVATRVDAVAISQGGPLYKVTDLGAFFGSISNANGINAQGDVTGREYSSTTYFGFLYKNGVMQQLAPVAGFGNSDGFSINNSDQVAGESAGYPTIWSNPGTAQKLFENNNGSVARAINNAGEATGASYLSPAWIWTPATGRQSIGTLGGNVSVGFAINQLGHVAGESQDRNSDIFAFLWSPQTGMQNLGAIGRLSYAYGVNDLDQVVGETQPLNTNGTRAFLWDSMHGMQNLGALSVGSSTAYGINNHGQVVGTSFGKAFIWDTINGMQDLNAFIPSTSSLTLGQANAINDAGQIVGWGYTKVGNVQHAFLLTPIPEPGSIILAAFGVVGMLLYRLHRIHSRDGAKERRAVSINE
jgi:probable HAF family extracellular repeat protein